MKDFLEVKGLLRPAYAKINRTLEVYGIRDDGFHELRSIVQAIALSDILTFDTTDDGEVTSDTGYGEKDLIVRAAKALRAACGAIDEKACGVHVSVEKRIPAGGGLGGGSADAAATLLTLNKLWRCEKTPEELAAIGASVGSDVPALVLAQAYRAPILMEGRGERVKVLPKEPGEAKPLLLVHPGVASATAEVYAKCAARTSPATGAVNDLQAAACALHPEIAMALVALTAAGATDVMMSGSGSVVYGFADDMGSAEAIASRMRAIGCRVWVTAVLS